MKRLFWALMVLATFCCSCSTFFPEVKFAPLYQGVDPKLQYLVDEWLWLSKQKHLIFTHNVIIGFKKINQGAAIGLCTYGVGWHEIDIDTDYWKKASAANRLEIVFHELTHCYCNRNHDYGNGIKYPAEESARIAQALDWVKNGGELPGRLEDGCPSSIMYPVALEDDCIWHHYNSYVSEMFNRCRPF